MFCTQIYLLKQLCPNRNRAWATITIHHDWSVAFQGGGYEGKAVGPSLGDPATRVIDVCLSISPSAPYH